LYFEVVTKKEAALEANHQTKLEIKLETNLKREVLIHLVMLNFDFSHAWLPSSYVGSCRISCKVINVTNHDK
jgi:hypothetical protein